MPSQTFKLDGDAAKYLQGRKSMKFTARNVADGVQLGCPEICVVPYIGKDDCSEAIFTPWGGGKSVSFRISGLDDIIVGGVEGIEDYTSPLNGTSVNVWDHDPFVVEATSADFNDLSFGPVGGMPETAGSCNRCQTSTERITIPLSHASLTQVVFTKTRTFCYVVSGNQITSFSIALSTDAVVTTTGGSAVNWVSAGALFTKNLASGANPLTSHSLALVSNPSITQPYFYSWPTFGGTIGGSGSFTYLLPHGDWFTLPSSLGVTLFSEPV